MRVWMIAAAAALAVPVPVAAWSQLAGTRSVSMLRGDDGGWTPALFVCDATAGDSALVLSPPDRDGDATLTRLARPGLAARRTAVRLGAADAGMSQRWYPLTDRAGRVLGNVHAVSPEMVEPGATTPTVTSITLGADTVGCRFAPQTRVLGVTARRSIQITGDAAGGYRYRSYNDGEALPELSRPWGGRDRRASLTIDGGRVIVAGDGQRAYEFANRGYVYRVFAAVDPARGGGGVQVWRGGRLLLSEPFGAYTAAR